MGVCGFVLWSNLSLAKSYMSEPAFVELVESSLTDANQLSSKTLWLKKPMQEKIKRILNHKYPKLRLRYKTLSPLENSAPSQITTIWFLEEIGKEKPISFGISVKNSNVQLIRVLEYRESRGYEVHIPAFTEQFDQIGVDNNGLLDKDIDGITGATMSVNAMKKIARLSILLHNTVINDENK